MLNPSFFLQKAPKLSLDIPSLWRGPGPQEIHAEMVGIQITARWDVDVAWVGVATGITKEKWMLPVWVNFTGWWFGTMEIIISIYWEFHHPNWLILFRGVETTSQLILCPKSTKLLFDLKPGVLEIAPRDKSMISSPLVWCQSWPFSFNCQTGSIQNELVPPLYNLKSFKVWFAHGW